MVSVTFGATQFPFCSINSASTWMRHFFDLENEALGVSGCNLTYVVEGEELKLACI